MIADVFKVFLIAFGFSALFSYPIYRTLLLTKSRQTIDPHLAAHQMKQGTPTMGGLIIFFALLVSFPLLLGILPNRVAEVSAYGGLFLAYTIIGFIDDFVVPRMLKGKRGLGWLPKLAMQVGFAVAASYFVFNGNLVAIGISTFLILFFSNAYNFADGLDGLSGSIWLALVPGLLTFTLFSPNRPDVASLVIACISGGVVTFLFYNAPPAKVFMGDVGSLPIGAVLGLAICQLAVVLGPAGEMVIMWDTLGPLCLLSLMMMAELFPSPMQVAYYKLTKKRLFPMAPIHHGFEKVGWPESRVVWTFALFQLVCSMGAAYWFLSSRGTI